MNGEGNSQAVSVTNLRCKFPGEKALVFQGLSLSVRQGEKVLLLGPSGSGKSTLLQILSGLIPRSVEIPMKCDDIQVPAKAGVVFQDPDTQFCMSFTDEEIAFVLENRNISREEMPALIEYVLKQVGLSFEQNRVLIQSMSQGMKQRLAIASMLAMDPEVLFLDEPTALLDDEGTSQVWDTVRRIASDKTIIIVEHKINKIVDMVDRIIVLSPEGKIVADGPAQQVFTDERGKLKAYGIWYPGVWDEHEQAAKQEEEVLLESFKCVWITASQVWKHSNRLAYPIHRVYPPYLTSHPYRLYHPPISLHWTCSSSPDGVGKDPSFR